MQDQDIPINPPPSPPPPPPEPEEPEEKPTPPAHTSWTPIDLSHGTFEDKELLNTRKLRSEMNRGLKGVLPKYATRDAVKKMIEKKRAHGLNRLEVKKGLQDLVKEGKLKPFQARALKRKFKAY